MDAHLKTQMHENPLPLSQNPKHSTKAIDERQRGIDLNLVWKLIHQMGGQISVHSDPDTKPETVLRIVV